MVLAAIHYGIFENLRERSVPEIVKLVNFPVIYMSVWRNINED